jgi:hypothetical protein
MQAEHQVYPPIGPRITIFFAEISIFPLDKLFPRGYISALVEKY